VIGGLQTTPCGATSGKPFRLADQRGFSLAAFMLLLGLTLTLGFVLSSIVVTDLRSSTASVESAQALASAEGGVELATGWLRKLPVAPTQLEPFTFASQVPIGPGKVDILIIPAPENQYTYLKRYTVRSQATVGEAIRTVEVQVRMVSFADFLWATDDEGVGTIWYYTGDVIDGPLFTNDQIAIYGSPVFLGPVYSAATSIKKGTSYNPDFRAGYRLGVPRITLPTMNDVLANYAQYGSGKAPVLYGSNNQRAKLTFKVVGGVGIVEYAARDASGNPVSGSLPLDQIPDGLIRIRGDVEVKGTVMGSLTILAEKNGPVSGGNIYIEDDLRYSCADASGRPVPGCEDRLGLVAQANVIVSNNPANQRDCVIDASIMALGTSFTVQGYNEGQPRGKLVVWGSIAQSVRGPVGTFSGNTLRTGYSKDYHYDSRMSSSPPPFFPKAGMYVVEAWREISPE